MKQKYPVWGEEIFLQAEAGNTPLHMQLLAPTPPNLPSGCLLIVHGMNEYIGRYAEIAEHFSDRYIVAGVDLTAHGLSNPVLREAHKNIAAGVKAHDVSKAYLEQAQLRNLQPMREDLNQALHYLVTQCDNLSTDRPLPIFILSHSLGSLVTASYLLETKYEMLNARVQGIIFSGPAFSVTQIPGWRGWFQNPLVKFSFYTHEHFLNPHNEPLPILLINQLLALITVPLQEGIIELLSLPGARSLFSPTTPAWVEDYLSDWELEKQRRRDDNYIIRRNIMRFVLGVEKEIIQFRRNMEQFDSPYLLIFSENDPITPSWGNTDFAKATFSHHQDNELFPLPGKSHHEQLFSSPKQRKQILIKIDDWIQQRIRNSKM